MPNPTLIPPSLINPSFLQINATCWWGVAQLIEEKPVAANNVASKNTATNKTPLAAQRMAVRTLCHQLLIQANRVDELDDSQFPYRLKKHGDYLCFTHSHDYVAVALNANRPCGIDIELSAVRWQTVQRFYHPDELALLEGIAPDLTQVLCRYLWQIKECIVKVEQGLLIPTLGRSLAPYIPELLNILMPYSSQTAYPFSITETLFNEEYYGCIKLSLPIRVDNSDYYIYLSPYSRLVSLA
ncbi:4'-phosphopantetheinyl transferase superfamily protein [Psychrobacter arenosus]|uniref:4'-phosphopantetheinyl transferase family protein n=1 Tax=Psychrobacter arenosus TaxID=256326 RepID=UPI001918B431|nr:hypothetical protein [Psychrobacter arenosus]